MSWTKILNIAHIKYPRQWRPYGEIVRRTLAEVHKNCPGRLVSLIDALHATDEPVNVQLAGQLNELLDELVGEITA